MDLTWKQSFLILWIVMNGPFYCKQILKTAYNTHTYRERQREILPSLFHTGPMAQYHLHLLKNYVNLDIKVHLHIRLNSPILFCARNKRNRNCDFKGATTLSIMALGIMTFSKMTLSINKTHHIKTRSLWWVSICWEAHLI